MIPSSSSPRLPTTVASASSADRQITAQDLPGSSSSAQVKPSYRDDDDFYFLYATSWTPYGTLKKETIEQLSKDHPGLFDGLDEPDDLFEAKPIKYQPLAKLIHDTPDLNTILDVGMVRPNERRGDGELCWTTKKVPYGIYKHGFYHIHEDYEGTQSLKVDTKGYEAMRKNYLFFSQLSEFLFDESMSNDEKVAKLKMIFGTIKEGEDDISIDQVCENMDLLFCTSFKEVQRQNIERGFAP